MTTEASNQDQLTEDQLADQAIEWFARLRADDVSSMDRKGFMQWLGLSKQHQNAFAEVLQLWDRTAVLKEADFQQPEAVYQLVNSL